jgi:type VI secretion system protein
MTIMAQLRLLERIKSMENLTPLPAGAEIQSEMQSILDHLQSLLNTRCGTVLIDEDYGIPDVFFSHGTSFKENTQTMMQLMTETIKKYEPRLSQVSIVAKERQRALLEQHFTLSATLTRDPDLSIELHVVISSDGKIKTTA